MSLTRDGVFWNAFGSHAAVTVQAAGRLVEMMEHPAEAERIAVEIKELEHKGDALTHEVVSALHQTWITPLDREEIHALISSLDDVLDYLHAASDWMALYAVTEVQAEAVNLARILLKAAEAIDQAVGALKDMKQAEKTLALCETINQLEHDADREFRRGLARLLKERANALEVIQWRDILGAIEGATDRAEDVANIIEGIVLEHS